jgi:hypothetical protein
MNLLGRKQVISLLLHHRNVLTGASGALLLVVLAVINFTVISPLFIPAVARQPHVADLTVVIPSGGVEAMAAAVRGAGFRQVHALSYDERVQRHPAFASYRQARGAFGGDVAALANTTFVLFGGTEPFAVPPVLPRLPDRPMVIGYSFATCHERDYALVGPVGLAGAMVHAPALRRFHAFAGTLKGSFTNSEAFRIFCDLHSLRLLMMPCRRRRGRLPKWEAMEVVEYESPEPMRPWDSIPHVEEVWSLTL